MLKGNNSLNEGLKILVFNHLCAYIHIQACRIKIFRLQFIQVLRKSDVKRTLFNFIKLSSMEKICLPAWLKKANVLKMQKSSERQMI